MMKQIGSALLSTGWFYLWPINCCLWFNWKHLFKDTSTFNFSFN